jgi:16S rRNA processing protein RimM
VLAEHLQIGRILGPHGIRGELRVYPLTDDPARFDSLKDCLLDDPAGGTPVPCRCLGVRHQQGIVLLRLRDVGTREEAERLKGRYLLVHRRDAVRLPADSYFICDLVGCAVETVDGESLGELVDVLATGSNDVYVVRKEGARDLLIPALRTVVRSVSIEGRLVRVVLPDGLRD